MIVFLNNSLFSSFTPLIFVITKPKNMKNIAIELSEFRNKNEEKALTSSFIAKSRKEAIEGFKRVDYGTVIPQLRKDYETAPKSMKAIYLSVLNTAILQQQMLNAG